MFLPSDNDDAMEEDDQQMAVVRAGDLRKPKPEPKTEETDEGMINMLFHIGVDPKRYRREHRRAFSRIVTEVFSPPRVTELLRGMPELGLMPGLAMDLTCIDEDDGLP